MRTNSDNADSVEPLVLESRGRTDGGSDDADDTDALTLFIGIERDFQNQLRESKALNSNHAAIVADDGLNESANLSSKLLEQVSCMCANFIWSQR